MLSLQELILHTYAYFLSAYTREVIMLLDLVQLRSSKIVLIFYISI